MVSSTTYIDIPFNNWSKQRLNAGEKTATTRTSPYGKEGDCFIVDDTIYRLSEVSLTSLEEVAYEWYEAEGCESPEEFKEVWRDIHPNRGYDPLWDVFLHVFEEVGDDE